MPHGPVALLPLWDNFTSVIWSTSPAHAKQLQAMDGPEFVAAVNAALTDPPTRSAPSHAASLPSLLRPLASLTESATTVLSSLTARHAPFRTPPHAEAVVGPRASFPLALSHANSYVKPGLALVG